MQNARFINPIFKEMVEKIPAERRRESELSYSIARRINEVLVRKGWTQADLAKAVGRPPAVVSRWMSGTQNFTLKTLASLEIALGERIISVSHYYKPSAVVEGYHLTPRREALLNDPAGETGEVHTAHLVKGYRPRKKKGPKGGKDKTPVE